MDYAEKSSWLLFLKYLDSLEQGKAMEAELEGRSYSFLLDEPYRWASWAAPKGVDGKLDHNKALAGDDLRDFVDRKLFPYLHGFKQKASGPNTIEYKIGEIFGEIKNKIHSGYILRDVIDHVDELSFGSQVEKHELSHLYEAKIKNMGNAGRNGGGGFGEDSGFVVIDNSGNGNHRKNESYGKAPLPSPDSQNSPDSQSSILIPRGDYQTLISYQKSEIVYQITYRFCQNFLKKGDRTVDQMVQAARSGKQNIVEGSKAAPTSKEMEIKLTNVARASLEELLEDYRDYLKVRDFPIWDKDSKEALYVRKLAHGNDVSYETYRIFVDTRPAEVVANIAICLVHQANYLLDQQLKRLEKDFLKDGGLRERMTKARLQARDQQRLEERRKG